MKSNFMTGGNRAARCLTLIASVSLGAACADAGEIAEGDIAASGVPVAQETHAQPTGIVVMLDQAKVIRIDHEADTVIIGNPAIADAVLYDRKTLVITGRAFGSTNLLILDDNGALVVDEAIRVHPAVDTMVTVHRATQSYTYSCAPTCRASIAPGDQADYFDNAIKQSQTRNDFATGNAAAPATQ